MKKWIISIVCALLIFAQLPFTSLASEEKVDVVALGDSLAYGVLADKTLGKGSMKECTEFLLRLKKS